MWGTFPLRKDRFSFQSRHWQLKLTTFIFCTFLVSMSHILKIYSLCVFGVTLAQSLHILCFSSSCEPYVAIISGLSSFDWPFGIL